MRRFRRLLRSEEGPTIVEYAVLIALIISVCVGSISLVGGGTVNFWQNNNDELNAAFSGS